MVTTRKARVENARFIRVPLGAAMPVFVDGDEMQPGETVRVRLETTIAQRLCAGAMLTKCCQPVNDLWSTHSTNDPLTIGVGCGMMKLAF